MAGSVPTVPSAQQCRFAPFFQFKSPRFAAGSRKKKGETVPTV
jgi:hypothetical protein